MSKEQPLVSVCMPLYNTERFLAEAIRSVLNQSYKNIELIICDNSSTDSSNAIAQQFAIQDPRIQLVRNKRNLGYAGNLHKVTSLARGDFMMVHCADDFAKLNAVEKMIRLTMDSDVNQHNVMVIADAYVTDAKGHPTHMIAQNPHGFDNAHPLLSEYSATGKVRRFKGKEALAYALPRLRIVGFMGATLYSRRLFESIEGVYNGLLYTPDLMFNYYLLSRDPDVLWLQEPLFYWRLHETNQMSQACRQAIPKQALDCYQYTFHFPPQFLKELGVKKQDLIGEFVDTYCLRKALQEIKHGSMILAFRHLCFGLTTYPGETLRNFKFYMGLTGFITGPLGRLLARMGYKIGIWRRKPVSLKSEAVSSAGIQPQPS